MKIVSYIRVSTKRQGDSGLGLEAQQFAVAAFSRQNNADLLAEYREIETGKRSDRPQLRAALAHCSREGATLVIAKLDRLARNVHFISGLMESDAPFVCCDMPSANRLVLHIMAAVAEAEAQAISDRTRAALQAAKARGVLLGSARPGHWDNMVEARMRGTRNSAATKRREAVRAYADISPTIWALRSAGKSLHYIVQKLNELGHTTRNGKQWNTGQLSRVLAMLGISGNVGSQLSQRHPALESACG
jgi:DNA invertase Pin-like site-specific DNA recombinase